MSCLVRLSVCSRETKPVKARPWSIFRLKRSTAARSIFDRLVSLPRSTWVVRWHLPICPVKSASTLSPAAQPAALTTLTHYHPHVNTIITTYTQTHKPLPPVLSCFPSLSLGSCTSLCSVPLLAIVLAPTGVNTGRCVRPCCPEAYPP